jgi:hypothetical protein
MPVLTIDRTVFFFLFFFLADLSYVGFVLVSDFFASSRKSDAVRTLEEFMALRPDLLS